MISADSIEDDEYYKNTLIPLKDKKLSIWKGKDMPIYKCKKCHKNCFTSNLKTANNKKCEYCNGKLEEVI
jgi:DNA-directed RNA polymerase subunit RPC12/RpoP